MLLTPDTCFKPMRALDKKLFRDLTHMKGQVVAVSLVVACGLAAFVTMWTAYRSLEASQQSFYRAYRFADVFGFARRAPDSLARKIREIPGVAEVRTRIVEDVSLDVPGLAEPATGRLISIPEQRETLINDIDLRAGRYIEPHRPDEVIISQSFADGNHLRPGDTFGAILNGRWRKLEIVGIAISPEYVYEIRPSDIFPDKRRFGVMWMSHEALGYAFDMHDAFNDVSLTVAPHADVEEIISRLDQLLAPWGGTGSYDREQQVSNRFLSDEIAGDRVSGIIIPTIFLGIAAFLIHIVLTRLVQTQRDQIAILKAFGYRNIDVGLHYLEFALVIILIGTAIGLPVGLWLARGLGHVYTQFFQLPSLVFDVDPLVLTIGIVSGAIAAMVGALLAARGAVRLPPAEAMRPEAPPVFKPGLVERAGLLARMAPATRIIIRNLARRRMKAFLSILSVALAVSILIVGRYSYDSIELLMEHQFHLVEREDVSVSFHLPRSRSVVDDLEKLPGVMRVEPWRTVPVRLRAGHRSRRAALLGIEPGSDLRRLVDRKGRSFEVPPEGLVLNKKLAEILGVSAGDVVTVEVLEGPRPVKDVQVTRIVEEWLGLSAYIDEAALARMMNEPRAASGAYLMVDHLHQNELDDILKHTPAVAGVALREALLQSFKDTIAENFAISTSMLVFFACVIAIGMVYNGARIALSERGRELASLRVLGFTRREVGAMLLGEQAILIAIAIPLGFALGYVFAAWISRIYDTEIYRMPLVVSARTYAFAFSVIVAAAIFSGLLIYRRIRTLDLVEVLKSRE